MVSWCSFLVAHLLIPGLHSLEPVQFCIESGRKFLSRGPRRKSTGNPIFGSIAPSKDADDSPTQIHWTQAYQSLIGSIGWLAMTARPDLMVIHSFLSSYSAKPSVGHMKLALYALHYIHSTYNYGISFTSENMAPMHSYIHYPPSTNVEAYTDAFPQNLSMMRTILAYSNACWGSQIRNAVAEGTLLPLFKFQSMNGGIVFKNSGPIGWLGKCQEHTSLSSCDAEIWATNATSKKVGDFCNLSCSVSDSGHTIDGLSSPTVFYNNNDACVKWSHNMTSKAARHIELRENLICKWVQDKTLNIVHVTGKLHQKCKTR